MLDIVTICHPKQTKCIILHMFISEKRLQTECVNFPEMLQNLSKSLN